MLKLICSRHDLPLRDRVLSSCSSLILLGSKSLRFHFSQEYGGGLVPTTNQSHTVHLHNRPFYSCGLSNTAAKRLRMRQVEHFRYLFQLHFPVRSKSPARSRAACGSVFLLHAARVFDYFVVRDLSEISRGGGGWKF